MACFFPGASLLIQCHCEMYMSHCFPTTVIFLAGEVCHCGKDDDVFAEGENKWGWQAQRIDKANLFLRMTALSHTWP